MICFCGMVDRQKTFSLIYSREYCQRSSPLWISDMPRAGFEPARNLSSGLVEWSYEYLVQSKYMYQSKKDSEYNNTDIIYSTYIYMYIYTIYPLYVYVYIQYIYIYIYINKYNILYILYIYVNFPIFSPIIFPENTIFSTNPFIYG